MLVGLQKAWGNQGFAARLDFLTEVATHAATTAGPILECGSGMTTILMGALAGRRGVKTYSLEHIPEWRQRVVQTIQRLQITNVEVLSAPLREFGEFDWYDAPHTALPDHFEFVICDGPPGNTRGGRYGLFPVLRNCLTPTAVILLDDLERPGEAEVLQRWKNEANPEVSIRDGDEGAYAVVSGVERSGARIGRREPACESRAPLISIIIPAYNVAPFIGETLESVLAQTFTDYEVIVINDGSPDTVEFELALKPYLPWVKYLKQENLGAGAARNAGLRSAQGEFVAFLDGDDLWMPNYLDEQIKFIRQHNCDLVCADALMFGDTPNSTQTYMQWLMNDAPETGTVSFRDLIGGERSLITSGVVARRRSILQTGSFDESLRTAQDFDLWLRLTRNGARLMYQRKPLLRYRCHPNGLTGGTLNSIKRELRVLDKIESDYDLTPAEISEVSEAIRRRRAILQFELGKVLIAQGEVAGARTSFAKACSDRSHWKATIALWLSRLAPFAMQGVCARRLKRNSLAS